MERETDSVSQDLFLSERENGGKKLERQVFLY